MRLSLMAGLSAKGLLPHSPASKNLSFSALILWAPLAMHARWYRQPSWRCRRLASLLLPASWWFTSTPWLLRYHVRISLAAYYCTFTELLCQFDGILHSYITHVLAIYWLYSTGCYLGFPRLLSFSRTYLWGLFLILYYFHFLLKYG